MPSILFKLYSTNYDKLATYFESSPVFKAYQKILQIDEVSRKRKQKIIPQESNELLSLFRQLTYGGPGFTKHFNYFENAICVSCTDLMKTSKKNYTTNSSSVSSNITFFKRSLDSETISLEKESTATKDDVAVKNIETAQISLVSPTFLEQETTIFLK